MLWKTHLAFGVLAGLVMQSFVQTGNKYIYFALVVIGSLLPDIDEKNSKISQKIPIIPNIIAALFKHRGITHTIWAALGITALLWLTAGKIYAIALLIGYMSHLIADSFTQAGINYLHPIAKWHHAGFVETGTFTETVILLAIIAVIVVKFVWPLL